MKPHSPPHGRSNFQPVNASTLLQHAKQQFNLKSFVDGAPKNPEHTLNVLNQLLAKEPYRVTGFVELGGLKHFNNFIKQDRYKKQVLNILEHPNFPFCFENIDSSGLGQTVYSISEKPGPLKSSAQKIFQIWRKRNADKPKKERIPKIRFDEKHLVSYVNFNSEHSVITFINDIKSSPTNPFRVIVSWSRPILLRSLAVRLLNLKKKLESPACLLEEERERKTLEVNDRTSQSPQELYYGDTSYGPQTFEIMYDPSLQPTPVPATPMPPSNNSFTAPPSTVQNSSFSAPNNVPISPQPFNTLNQGQNHRRKRPRSETDESFIKELFDAMTAAGFPNPNSAYAIQPSKRPRFDVDRIPNRNSNYGDQLGGGPYRGNPHHFQGRNKFNNHTPMNVPICRQFNSRYGCRYGESCKFRHVKDHSLHKRF